MPTRRTKRERNKAKNSGRIGLIRIGPDFFVGASPDGPISDSEKIDDCQKNDDGPKARSDTENVVNHLVSPT